jgi:hypothetical protein
MLALLHVIIALMSLVQASFTAAKPGKNQLRISYSLIAGTLVSGTYLVVHMRSSLMSACVSGLTYLAVIMVLLITAQYRLAQDKH